MFFGLLCQVFEPMHSSVDVSQLQVGQPRELKFTDIFDAFVADGVVR